MYKRLNVLFTLLLICGMHLQAQEFETATQAVKNMGVGWNLGNTLDANNQTNHDFTKDNYWGQQGLESETCWGQSKAKPELIKMMKDAGFGAIRVPVTWYNHMDKDGKVNAEWMKRVHEVVDYVINQGLYCIVNVHHDTGADGSTFKSWIKADEANYEQNKTRYENLWKQIAEEFKDYDEHLLFESYNEMLDKLSSWCFASYASTNKYDAAVAKSAYNAINSYAQSFVTTVRNTGGNNATRNLVVNTYAACCGSGTWNDHLKEPLSQLTIPTDPVANHLMVQVHDYPNIANGIANVKKEIDDMMTAWNTHILSKGIPMILGEWGTANVDEGDGKTDYDVRRDVMFEFVDYMIAKCKEHHVATFYWMGLSDGAYRSLPAFNQPDLAERIAKAYHGSDFAGTYPTENDFNISYLVEYEKEWAELFLYGNYNSVSPLKLTEYKGLRIEMDDNYGSKLQVKVYGDATGSSFKEAYYTLSANSKTTTVNFENAKTGSTVSRITLQTNVGATKAKINKVVLIKSDNSEVKLSPTTAWGCTLSTESTPVSGIHELHYTPQTDNRIYNLQGQQIAKPQRGIYIQNGKKHIAK
ncbi:glycoside hydrolase family 5 protein [Prevotella sp. RM4]|uniref:glycoside hydrolase family 5 protein n=1 Tax=Prevotella sp. RM4 TaxID=1200547 RepID=UPI000A06ACAE|nr:glycoside hydrolase family 5 protein [Prevotella sp. RM4]